MTRQNTLQINQCIVFAQTHGIDLLSNNCIKVFLLNNQMKKSDNVYLIGDYLEYAYMEEI